MTDKPYTIEEALTILAEGPPRIAALTAGLAPEQLHTAPQRGEWSANDVLAHLRACSDVWGDYMNRIITQDMPSLRPVSPRTWIKKTDYCEQEFQPSLRAFTAQRTDLLAVLEALPPEGWSRWAVVTTVGRIYERTVMNYAERLARHEREHVRQIEGIANTIRKRQP